MLTSLLIPIFFQNKRFLGKKISEENCGKKANYQEKNAKFLYPANSKVDLCTFV